MTENTLKICFYCLLVIIPSLIFPLLLTSYRINLKRKIFAFKNVFSNDDNIKQILGHFNNYKKNKKYENMDYFSLLFRDIYFSRWSYIFPIAILMAISVIGSCAIFIKLEIRIDIFGEYVKKMLGLEITVLLGFVGAYIWGLNDILIRKRNLDLTPNSLHFIWLKILIASVVGYIIIQYNFNIAAEYSIAFIIGAFPVKTIREFFQGIAGKHLSKFSNNNLDYESYNHGFSSIEGLHPQHIKRLREENINCNQNLAYQDPIPLYLRTNIEWKVLLDLIDQSLLYCYIDDNVEKFRKFGIRGAIDAATLYQEYYNQTEEYENIVTVIEGLSKILDIDFRCTVHLLKILYDDFCVVYIWTLWENTTYYIEDEIIEDEIIEDEIKK